MLLGLIIYLLFNKNTLIARFICSFLPIPNMRMPNGLLIDAIKGYGADYLWSIAFVLTIQSILALDRKKLWLLLLCSLLGILYEILQFIGVIYGTADILDVFVYFGGSLSGAFIIFGGNYYEKS